MLARLSIIDPYVIAIDPYQYPVDLVVNAATVSHRTERKFRSAGEQRKFVRNLIRMGHDSTLEFALLQFEGRLDRATANELVRHRMASYCQESTRYCDYYDNLDVIKPMEIGSYDSGTFDVWRDACIEAHDAYRSLIRHGVSKQTARSVLPQCTATTLRFQMNMRSLRNFVKLRYSRNAHPDMQVFAGMVIAAMPENYLIFIDDILSNNQLALSHLPMWPDINRMLRDAWEHEAMEKQEDCDGIADPGRESKGESEGDA